MKKILMLTFLVTLSFNTLAVYNAETLDEDILESSYEDERVVSELSKTDFKERLNSQYNLLVKINTNFKAPLVGKDIYFGYIYTVPKNDSEIKYRDELIANRHYKEEINRPVSQYMSSYKVSDFRAKNGLELINAAGAYVRLKSNDFSMTTGGTLKLDFKIPNQKSGSVDIIVRNIKGQLKTYVKNSSGSLVIFDSLTLNARKGLLTFGTSILAGIKSIEFKMGNSNVHTFEMNE